MSNEALSRDLALRIGLAARALPDTEASRLMTVLVDRLGLPITEEGVAGLTVKDLKTAAEGELGEMPVDSLKQALGLLKGESAGAAALPEVRPLAEGEMGGSIRVACASASGERVDGHFGSCPRFLIYQVSKDEVRLIELRSTAAEPPPEDKNAHRAELIRDCQVLYVASIGGPAAAKVVKTGIHPVKLPEGGEALEVLAELQRVLAASPPPWLAKVMGLAPEERARFGAAG
jgi:nitrogen fixation protein NifX